MNTSHYTDAQRCIAVDFDGTLASQTRNGELGRPVRPMLERVKQWLTDGIAVTIFTARATDPAQCRQIRQWCRDNDLPELPVTAIKDSAMTEFWDNRAIRVQQNTGKVCPGCEPSTAFAQPHTPHAPVTNTTTARKNAQGMILTDC